MKKPVAIIAFALLLLWFSVFIAWTVVDVYPREKFSNVNDRPVLESKDTIWQARAGKVSTFRYDGLWYVIDNLPDGYLEYSERYCRMP